MKKITLKISMFVVAIFMGFVMTNTVYAEGAEPTAGARALAIILAPANGNSTTDYDHSLVEVSGDTVKLLQDINLIKSSSFIKVATLDLAGHTLNMGTFSIFVTSSGANVGNLTITGQSGSLITGSGSKSAPATLIGNTKGIITVNGNVKIQSTSTYAAILLNNSNTLNVNDNTIIESKGNGITANKNSTVIVNNGTISGKYGIYASKKGGNTIKVNNGTISGKYGIYADYTSVNNKIDFSNGTVSADKYGIFADSNSITNISGGTIKSKNEYGIVVFGDNPSLTITNGNITGELFALSTNGKYTKNATITINGGSLTGTSSTAMYLPGTGKTTINNGTITGKAGIVARGGELEINGGTITATGNEDLSVGDSHTLVPANALVVDEIYADLTNVTINNGNFVGDTSFIKSKEGTDKVTEDAKLVITGGAFSTEIKDYVVAGKVEVSVEKNDDTTYYVGDNAVEAVLDAEADTKVNILQGDLEVSNVTEGVKVTNSGNGTVKINDQEITPEDNEVTIINYDEEIDALKEELEHYDELLDGNSDINLNEIKDGLKSIEKQIKALKNENLNDDQKTAINELSKMLEAVKLKLEKLEKASATPTNNAQTSSMNINLYSILSILSLTGIGYILYSKKRGEI